MPEVPQWRAACYAEGQGGVTQGLERMQPTVKYERLSSAREHDQRRRLRGCSGGVSAGRDGT